MNIAENIVIALTPGLAANFAGMNAQSSMNLIAPAELHQEHQQADEAVGDDRERATLGVARHLGETCEPVLRGPSDMGGKIIVARPRKSMAPRA